AKEIERYDPTLAQQYYKRAQYLQDGGRQPSQSMTAQYSPLREQSPAVGQPAGVPQSSSPAGGGIGPAQIMRSGPGRLYRPGFTIEGQATYGLDQGVGKAPLYVTAQPGLDLQPYLNRNVELHGTMTYNPRLRNYQMTVVQVIQQQP